MRVEVKGHHKPITATKIDMQEPQPDYPLGVSSFIASIGAHCGAIATIVALSTLADPPAATPVSDEFMKPHEHHILLYDLGEKVPHVAPLKDTGDELNLRGVEVSKQAIIATSPKPESARLFMSAPAPEIQINQDLPAPLLVTKIDIKLSPPPERPKPRKFAPPPSEKA